VVASRPIVRQTSRPPQLRHKGRFPYEWLRLPHGGYGVGRSVRPATAVPQALRAISAG